MVEKTRIVGEDFEEQQERIAGGRILKKILRKFHSQIGQLIETSDMAARRKADTQEISTEIQCRQLIQKTHTENQYRKLVQTISAELYPE